MDRGESNYNVTSDSQNDLYSSSFRMRCPECFKSYTVDWADIHEVQPRFACVSCHTQFYVDAVQALETKIELIGVKENYMKVSDDPAVAGGTDSGQVASLETADTAVPEIDGGSKEDLNKSLATNSVVSTPTASYFNCPKCSAPYAPGESECKKCGVIFLKFAEKKIHNLTEKNENGIVASAELKGLWEDVLQEYETEVGHQKFINAAWAEASLDYAASKYAGILEVLPQDEQAQRGLARIKELSAVQFEIAEEEGGSALAKWYRNFNFLEFLQLGLKRLRITNIIMFVCAIIIVMGVFTPGMRNLVGFGTSILFFILALRFYFRVI